MSVTIVVSFFNVFMRNSSYVLGSKMFDHAIITTSNLHEKNVLPWKLLNV